MRFLSLIYQSDVRMLIILKKEFSYKMKLSSSINNSLVLLDVSQYRRALTSLITNLSIVLLNSSCCLSVSRFDCERTSHVGKHVYNPLNFIDFQIKENFDSPLDRRPVRSPVH